MLPALAVLCAILVLVAGASACGDDISAAEAPLTPVGLTTEAAGELADAEGWAWRVIEIDGEALAVSQDFMPERLNFVVSDGVVVSAKTDAELAGG